MQNISRFELLAILTESATIIALMTRVAAGDMKVIAIPTHANISRLRQRCRSQRTECAMLGILRNLLTS